MEKNATFVFMLLLSGAIIVSCGTSKAERDAQATKIVADAFATQTAKVPTPTITPTNTPTLTPTWTPEPTLTPVTDPIPPQVEGWTSANLNQVCLVFKQDGLGYPEQHLDPVEAVYNLNRLLEHELNVAVSGLWDIEDETLCDAFMDVTLAGKTLKQKYTKVGRDYTCFAGAEVTGTIVLRAEARPDLEVSISEIWPPPDELFSCAETEREATGVFTNMVYQWRDYIPDLWGMTENEFYSANGDF